MPTIDEEAVILGTNSCEDYEWECITELLTELLNDYNAGEVWYAEVKNFGWRNLNGHKFFEAWYGSELLSEILPDTECRFSIYRRDGYIAIQNFHHDSPTGEWYYIYPAERCEYCNECCAAGDRKEDEDYGLICKNCQERFAD